MHHKGFGVIARWVVPVLVLLTVGLMGGTLQAQVLNTDSPLTQFGLGFQLTRGYNRSLGMGGVTQGLRDANIVNYDNPASYTCQDTMSFILDVALGGRYQHLSAPGSGVKHKGAGLVHHLAMQFPIGKWLGMAAGFQPFTEVGYDITRFEEDPKLVSSISRIRYHHKGHGGTNMVFLGLAGGPVAGVSLGVNAQFIFGSLNAEQNVYFPGAPNYSDVIFNNRSVIRGVGVMPSLQYELQLPDSLKVGHSLVLGVTVELMPFLQNEIRMEASAVRLEREIILAEDFSRGKRRLSLPPRYRGGALYRRGGMSVAVDGGYQNWQGFDLTGTGDFSHCTQWDVHFGMQFVPRMGDLRNYMRRVSYRVGGYLYQLPFTMGASPRQMYDMGVSFGMGFPFRWSSTVFHVTFVAGRRGGFGQSPLTEFYGEFVLGASLNDIWFFKRKFD